MVYLVKSARYVFKIADVVIQRTIPHLKKKFPRNFWFTVGKISSAPAMSCGTYNNI